MGSGLLMFIIGIVGMIGSIALLCILPHIFRRQKEELLEELEQDF